MEYSLKNWMKNVDDDRNFLSLNIIGTHDCVTQFVQLSKWARCQDTNIFGQLSLGARALDIRTNPKGDCLMMVHGITKAFNEANHFSKQMEMCDVLEQVYLFLKENPSEAVIFQFKNENKKEMEKSFKILYEKHIKKDPEMWFVENRVPKMGEVRGKIVLIRRCCCDNNTEITNCNSGIDFSTWVEQDELSPNPLVLTSISEKKQLLNTFIIQDRFKYKSVPRWRDVIKPFLDERREFDGTYIVNYLSTAGGVKGPYKNALYINKKFIEYDLKKVYYGTTYVDFINEKLSRKYIDTNF